jgi:hypothetical protein
MKIIIYVSIFAFALVFLLAAGIFRRYDYIKKTNSIIDGKETVETLLNINFKETAQELIQSSESKE